MNKHISWTNYEVFYVKSGATGLISHRKDEKISKFSVIKKKTKEKRPLA